MDTVKTGREKQDAYRKEYARLNKALKEEFYLEAIAICYAIIEDRFIAFFHHAGIVSRSNSNLRINRVVYPYLRRLLNKDDKYAIKIKDISVKESLVIKLLTMDESTAKEIDNHVATRPKEKMKHVVAPGYMFDLYKQIHKSIDNELIADIFHELEPWRDTRNQLIHALLNKTTTSSEPAKKQCAEKGCSLARGLDNCLVKPFKEGNMLRKKYTIQ